MCALMYSSGLRIGEVCLLRYEDIDRKHMRIHVCRSKARQDRYASLSKFVLDLLTQYWFACGRPTGWLFPGSQKRDSDRPINTYYLPWHIHRHEERLGWPKRLPAIPSAMPLAPISMRMAPIFLPLKLFWSSMMRIILGIRREKALPDLMEKVLDILKKESVQGAFFLVGNYLEIAPELVRRMVDEGHIIGNHSYHHEDMCSLRQKNSKRNLPVLKKNWGKSQGNAVACINGRLRESIVRKICRWQKKLDIRQCSGVLLAWTGMTMTSQRKKRRLTNCSQEPIQGSLCF